MVAAVVLLITSVWLLIPAGSTGTHRHASAPPTTSTTPTTLARPSTVTFPPQTPRELAACPNAVTPASVPFGSAVTTAPGDLPPSGSGQISTLAWSIPIDPTEDPKLTTTPEYVVSQTGGTVVVSDASSGNQATATLVGLAESNGAPKWSVSIQRSLGSSAGSAELPILDAVGDTLSFVYAEGGQIRAATVSLSSGSLVACDLVGDPAAFGGPVLLHPVAGGLFASITDASGVTSLVRLAAGTPSWSTAAGYDTVFGGTASVLVVGHGLTGSTPPSGRSTGGQSIAGLDAATGKLLWKEPMSSLVADRSLHSYDQSPTPRTATGSLGGLPYDGSSNGTLDGVTSNGQTSFNWAPHLQNNAPWTATPPSVPCYLLTIQTATGRLVWGGWSIGNSLAPLADGVGGIWLATGPAGPPVEWISTGPGGAAKGFPTQGHQAAAGGGRIVVSSSQSTPGSQYGTEVLADRTGQIGTLSLDSANLSSDTQANGALSGQAWTGIARYNTVANLSAGRSPDYAIVSYRVGGGAGTSTPTSTAPSTPTSTAPSPTSTTTPPRIGGQKGQQ